MWICPKCAKYFKEEPILCPYCGPEGPLPAVIHEPKEVLPSVRTFLQTIKPVVERERKRRLFYIFLTDTLEDHVPPASLPTVLILFAPLCALLCIFWPRHADAGDWIVWGRWLLLWLAFASVLVLLILRAILVKTPVRQEITPSPLYAPQVSSEEPPTEPNTQVMDPMRPNNERGSTDIQP